MGTRIIKIRLKNFKRFEDYTIEPNDEVNILVGDNEAGKSSILEAIDIVACGSVRWVENIGLDRLMNAETVKKFNEGERTLQNLPELRVELYLTDTKDHTMNGKNNLDKRTCDGIRLVCEPNVEYSNEISEALNENNQYFPYEYYSIHFSTFADDLYSGYKRPLKCVKIDSSKSSAKFATDDFVRRMYMQYTEGAKEERVQYNSQYRMMREMFGREALCKLNTRAIKGSRPYKFGLKNGSAMDINGDLMIYEDGISLDCRGEGEQVFIKTDFALERSGENVDVILIEEPENHLSPVNLRRLIRRIAEPHSGQLFITTHNSLISTRLELQNLLIMHINDRVSPVKLYNLSEETAKYFMKTPPANIIEYVLSQKVILVEGPSEFMLMEKFYKAITAKNPEEDNVNIIDIRGLSFLRYLEVAKLLHNKVAVITDNDGDYNRNCIEKYSEYANCSDIEIFYDSNISFHTFEYVLYNSNTELCDDLFGKNAREYMVRNKTECAYKLIQEQINVPGYIKCAIEWIRN